MTQAQTAQRMLIISDSEITAAYGVSAEADELNTISSCSFTDDIESALCDCELREVLIDLRNHTKGRGRPPQEAEGGKEEIGVSALPDPSNVLS